MRSAADETGYAGADVEMRVPTSVILEGLLHDAPKDQVTLNWIIDHLGARSFGIIMLIIALWDWYREHRRSLASCSPFPLSR
jgi:hypothetical protein